MSVTSIFTLSALISITLLSGCSETNKSSKQGFAGGITGGHDVSTYELHSSPATSVVSINEVRSLVKEGSKTSVQTGTCSGTLIQKNYVLTSAHCFLDPHNPKETYVLFDSKPDFFKSLKIRAQEIFIHPEYLLNRGHASDLALIRLESEAPHPFTPIEIAALSNHTILESLQLSVFGFGRTQGYSYRTQDNGILRKVQIQIPLVSLDTAVIAFDGQGRGLCHGDSGGPAFIQLQGKHFLFGVNVAISPKLTQDQIRELQRVGTEKFFQRYSHINSCAGESHWINLQLHLDWIYSLI